MDTMTSENILTAAIVLLRVALEVERAREKRA